MVKVLQKKSSLKEFCKDVGKHMITKNNNLRNYKMQKYV